MKSSEGKGVVDLNDMQRFSWVFNLYETMKLNTFKTKFNYHFAHLPIFFLGPARTELGRTSWGDDVKRDVHQGRGNPSKLFRASVSR